MLWILLDLIIAAIVIICILISSKRGFVRSVIEVIGSIIIIYLCVSISNPLASLIFTKSLKPAMVTNVTENIEKSSEVTVDTVWQALPDIAKNNSEYLGIDKTSLEKFIYIDKNNASMLATSAVNTVAKPVLLQILSLSISIISITILLFLVKLLAKAINKLFSFSIIGSVNRFLGGILGILKGIVLCLVFVMIISLLKSLTGNNYYIFTDSNINKTYIFKYFYGALPFFK